MSNLALDLLVALSLGMLTAVGLGFMGFSAYLALFTKLDPKTPREGRLVIYAGWGSLGLSVCFVLFLLGLFVLRSLR